jgi:hypothetical protein
VVRCDAYHLCSDWFSCELKYRQRRAGRKGKLTTERVRLLNEINFIWDPRGSESNVEVVETILQVRR